MATVWSYGVTTMRARRDDLLPRTLASLKAGGFPEPRLFLDDGDDIHDYKRRFGLQVTAHYPRIWAWGNWILALYELYIREPSAGRYALFQDDILMTRNTRNYLERCSFPVNCYWNLITYPSNFKLADKAAIGWYPSAQNGMGAQALVFDREGVKDLITSPLTFERPQHERGKANIDGGVVDAMKRLRRKELVHNPSLVFHVGDKSIIGHGKQPDADSFRGESFDALQLQPSKAWLFGDHVAQALSSVGVTTERVEKWLGANCGCAERRQKLNELGLWARRVLGGAKENAEEYLNKIMGG